MGLLAFEIGESVWKTGPRTLDDESAGRADDASSMEPRCPQKEVRKRKSRFFVVGVTPTAGLVGAVDDQHRLDREPMANERFPELSRAA